MSNIDKLKEYFQEFPGIGPRQAERFTYFLLRKGSSYTGELARLISTVQENIIICSECMRYFNRKGNEVTCPICSNVNRDHSQLMVVARDVDFQSIEKSDMYKGYYFILGGLIPILEKEPERKIRLQQLKDNIERRIEDGLEEIILALNANPDGDNTADYLRKDLESFGLPITILGRGLSTGTELEYSDTETIHHALKNRK